MKHLKITIVLVIVGALGMIKKGTDKHIITKIHGSLSQYEIQKNFHFIRESIINVTEKYHPKEAEKYRYIECI